MKKILFFFSDVIIFILTRRSPMTGKIVSIHVKPGDAVVAGDVLFIIESMKMETKVVAMRDGVVDDVFASAQALVEDDQKIVSLK
jgi:biotin carboxyl carrier protein